MLASANQAQYACLACETGSGGRVIAAVHHCTAVLTSLPPESALNAPWAAAWQALAGAPPRLAQENRSAYERSSAVGPTFACGADLRCCSTTSHVDLLVEGCPGAAAAGAGGMGAPGSCPPTRGGVGATGGGGTDWAAGWAVACGIASLGENHVGFPVSPASGTRGAHAGRCTGAPDGSCGEAGRGSATGPGAHPGRPGGPDCGGATGPGCAGTGSGWGMTFPGDAGGEAAARASVPVHSGSTGGPGGFAPGLGAGVGAGGVVGGGGAAASAGRVGWGGWGSRARPRGVCGGGGPPRRRGECG